MFLFGLLLVVLGGAFAGLLIAYNTSGGPEYTVTLFDREIATVDTLQAFVSGSGLALVVCLGLWMMGTSARLRRARRQAEAAAAERDRLANDLAQQQIWRTEAAASDADGTAPAREAGAVRHRRHRPYLLGR
jgi:hypothetical protein